MASRRFGIAVAVVGLLLVCAPAHAKKKRRTKKEKPTRVAWVGLARGPLSPSKAKQVSGVIKRALLENTDIHVVDTSGRPLDDRALGDEAERVAKLLSKGIDALLELKHQKATKHLDRAIELFESDLTPLPNHEILHDALLAKAEAQSQAKQKETAKITLQRFVALEPSIAPTTKTHPPKFVALYDKAKATIGPVGYLQVKSTPPGAQIQIDGRVLSPAPATSKPLRPGKHYVVARWPDFTVVKAVQLGEGKTVPVMMRWEGPAAKGRADMLDVIDRRRGADSARKLAKKLGSIAVSDAVLVAGIRRVKGGKAIFVARHEKDGSISTIGRAAFSGPYPSNKAVRTLAQAVLQSAKQPQQLEVAADGQVGPAEDLNQAMYGGRTAELEPPPPPENPALTTPPESQLATVEDEDDGGPKWWVWALVGAVAAGAAAGGIVLFSPGAQTTAIELSLPPR